MLEVRINRALLSGVTLAVLIAGGSAGCGVSVSTPRHPVLRSGSVPKPYVRFSPGEWTATGTILDTQAADARPGETIVRPWDFTRSCENRSCRTIFSRQTLYHREETPLDPRDGRYVAVFPPATVPCPHYPGEDAGTSQVYATFTLWRSANREVVYAIEHERYMGQQCGGGQTETVRWVAKRTNPTARMPAMGP